MEINNKFGIQQTVFIMYENKVKKMNVEAINIDIDKNGIKILYTLDDGHSKTLYNIQENNIYSTKEELLKTL